MTFEQFIEKAACTLEQHYGEKYQIRIVEVKKNNGLRLHGLSIFLQDSPNKVSPTIYLDEYYSRYMSGISLSETMQDIIRTYEAHTVKDDISMEFFLDYEKVRDRVVYKLINYEMNKELLQEIPYIPFLDLAVIFYYYMENEVFGTASILIYHTHMKKWDISMERLTADAEYNTPRVLGYRLANMEDIVRELLRKELEKKFSKKNRCRQGDGEKEIPTDEVMDKLMECYLEGQDESPMYVLTNRNSQNGAACIRYPNVLKECADRLGSDLYILPSSIHEVILIKDYGIDDADVLRNMVKDVNRTQLAPEEVLSDQVYYYSRKRGRVELCENKTRVK